MSENEDSSRNIRGGVPRSNPLQSGEKTNRGFVLNGFKHFPFDASKTVTVGLLVGIVWFIGYAISNYKLALSEIDSRIIVNPQVIEMKIDLKNLNTKQEDHETRIRNAEAQLNARRK